MLYEPTLKEFKHAKKDFFFRKKLLLTLKIIFLKLSIISSMDGEISSRSRKL
jgi:hypothetical protein